MRLRIYPVARNIRQHQYRIVRRALKGAAAATRRAAYPPIVAVELAQGRPLLIKMDEMARKRPALQAGTF